MKDTDDSFESLKGKTIKIIEGMNTGSGRVTFETEDGEKYTMWHGQDCCESVQLEEIVGGPDDLLNSPVLLAEEVSDAEGPKPSEWSESYTWTFYKLSTIKGSVTLRWLGESNGYYSERVDFVRNTEENSWLRNR